MTLALSWLPVQDGVTTFIATCALICVQKQEEWCLPALSGASEVVWLQSWQIDVEY